jgi:hypothetical protein
VDNFVHNAFLIFTNIGEDGGVRLYRADIHNAFFGSRNDMEIITETLSMNMESIAIVF